MRIKLGIILLSIFLLSFVVACKSGNNNNDNNLKYPDVEDDLKEDSKGTLKFKVTFIIDEDENFYKEVEENKQTMYKTSRSDKRRIYI